MRFENRKLVRIIIVGAIVGAMSAFISMHVESGLKKATHT